MTDWLDVVNVLVPLLGIPVGLVLLWGITKLRDRFYARYDQEQKRLADLALAEKIKAYEFYLRTDSWEHARRTSCGPPPAEKETEEQVLARVDKFVKKEITR